MIHPNLSEIKSSSSSKIFESWNKNKKIEKEYKNSNLDTVKLLILKELSEIIGTGLSLEKYNYYEINIKKQRTINDLIFFIWNSQAAGENMQIG